LQKKIAALVHASEHAGAGDAMAHAKYSKETIIPAMNAVRVLADKLEGIVADDLWPLPTYREMLFIK
jgi:glutamine synthetase